MLIATYNVAALATRPFTILRTRFDVEYASDQSAASEFPTCALGLIVVSDQASAIGVTAVPKPDANSDGDFFVWQGMHTSLGFFSSVGILGSEFGRRYEIDSKAMRKVGANQDLAVVVENLTAVGADFTMTGRQLIQLH